MNGERFFNFNQTPETIATPEEELSGELAAESAKLESNLEGLGQDVEELGGEENLKEALEKQPHIAISIAKRAAIIAPILISINTVLSGSFAESIQAEDIDGIIRFISVFTGGSAIISTVIETVKMFSKKQAE